MFALSIFSLFLAFSHLSFFHHFSVFQFFLWMFAYSCLFSLWTDLFLHTCLTYLFAPGNHVFWTNGKGSSPFFASVGCREKPCRLRNNYTRSKLLEMLDNEGFANQYNFVQLGLKHELKSFKVADLSPKYIFGNATDCTKLDLNIGWTQALAAWFRAKHNPLMESEGKVEGNERMICLGI